MKKQKNTLTKVTILALLLVILAILVLASTYAKYTTNVNGKAVATIAKWDFIVANGDDALTKDFQISLVDTATNAVEGKIQPGSNGSFVLTVVNNGEVPADFTAEVVDSADSVFEANQFTVTVDGNNTTVEPGETKDITINWNWAYELANAASDTDDTNLGETTTGKAQDLLTISVTGTQVNPNN